MRFSISIILFMAIFSTVTNSFPLSPKIQPQLSRRRAPYSVVPVDGGPKSTTTTHSGLLVTVPPRITKTAVSESSSPTSTETSSLPPRTTPFTSTTASSTTLIYRPSSLNPPYVQPGPTGGFRLQPSHTTIRISHPTPSLILPPRYGSNNGTYYLPTLSSRLPN